MMLLPCLIHLNQADANGASEFDYAAILTIIYTAFGHLSILTRLAALRWVEVLLAVNPEAVFNNSPDLMPYLLKLLSDPSVEASLHIVHSTVSLVGSLCKHPVAQRVASSSKEDRSGSRGTNVSSVQRLFTTLVSGACSVDSASAADRERANLLCLRFLYDLVQRFITDPGMLNEKGNLIITDLCLALGAKSVYYVMALIISNLLNPKQAFDIVKMLNQILLTQPSVLTFRDFLHNIDLEKEANLFEELYRAWCHNPVALLALCLLTQNYSHCCVLVKSFGDLTMSVEVLMELDRLVQLIESPVFARLRLHLVDRRHSAALQETLYCLLMCLPQTDAFDTLRRRLQCLPGHMLTEPNSSTSHAVKVDFDSLLAHFHAVQRLHEEWSLQEESLMSSVQGDDCNVSRKASAPVELGFVRSTDVATPKIANSTQFLVKGLKQLGIEVLPPPPPPSDST
ncbi:unnamed protein product [Rodentolepis nana]|uniref:Vac14_Fig4_bd domain-containing protein n=1 Tax=Rodentolepis nana TaxID=102285 RepID=A0A0R3TF36_RODNA|nr:unnamed protein product [Rodentolepis nana]